jgi:hypothetical protein
MTRATERRVAEPRPQRLSAQRELLYIGGYISSSICHRLEQPPWGPITMVILTSGSLPYSCGGSLLPPGPDPDRDVRFDIPIHSHSHSLTDLPLPSAPP